MSVATEARPEAHRRTEKRLHELRMNYWLEVSQINQDSTLSWESRKQAVRDCHARMLGEKQRIEQALDLESLGDDA